MVAQPTNHPLQGHGPLHPTIAQQILGVLEGAIPQDDLTLSGGGAPQAIHRLGVTATLSRVRAGREVGTIIHRPQSPACSQLTWALIFQCSPQCRSVAACRPGGPPVWYKQFRNSELS